MKYAEMTKGAKSGPKRSLNKAVLHIATDIALK